MSYQAKAAQYKKDEVSKLTELMKEYPVVGIVNVENLPAAPLQVLRSKLRKDVLIRMSKKPLIKRAIDEAKGSKKGFEQLKESVEGMPALLLTKESPFKVSRLIRESKSKAPAKAGQTAPYDLSIPAGPTQFTPGPIISELGAAGLKTGVEGGKIVIKEPKTVVKAGEPISQKMVELLAKFDIKPMDIGLDLVAAYEDGLIYGKNVLSVDASEYLEMLRNAAAQALGFSVEIAYPTKESVHKLIAKAYSATKSLALQQNILSDVWLEAEIASAERAAESVAASANIDVAVAIAENKEVQVTQQEKAIAKEEVGKEEKKSDESVKQSTANPLAAAEFVKEEFKEEISAEKRRRERVDAAKAEELAQQLKRKGTLRQ